MNTKVRPWVTWTDFVLIICSLALFLFFEGAQYHDGLTGGIVGFATLLLLPAIPIFGIVLLVRPWVDKPRDRRLHQLWIRPLLVGSGFLGLWAIQRFSPFSDPEVTPYLKGQWVSVQSLGSEENIAALRKLGALKYKEQKDKSDWNTIPEEELPKFLKNRNWGLPRPITLSQHVKGIEMEVCWGGTLPGYFGLIIDPEEPPKEGKFESDDGAFRLYRKLADDVYFYHSNG